ncbi:MAG: hypothetical protein JW942_07830 [Opitutales bacterium]|nr:hypothetical protein [Opitutales bacterium]
MNSGKNVAKKEPHPFKALVTFPALMALLKSGSAQTSLYSVIPTSHPYPGKESVHHQALLKRNPKKRTQKSPLMVQTSGPERSKTYEASVLRAAYP